MIYQIFNDTVAKSSLLDDFQKQELLDCADGMSHKTVMRITEALDGFNANYVRRQSKYQQTLRVVFDKLKQRISKFSVTEDQKNELLSTILRLDEALNAYLFSETDGDSDREVSPVPLSDTQMYAATANYISTE